MNRPWTHWNIKGILYWVVANMISIGILNTFASRPDTPFGLQVALSVVGIVLSVVAAYVFFSSLIALRARERRNGLTSHAGGADGT